MALTQVAKARRLGYWWILVSTGGFIAGTGIAGGLAFTTEVWHLFLPSNEYSDALWVGFVYGGAGVVVGTVVGFGQFLVLRQWFKEAGWWLLATALGLGLGNLASAITFSSVRNLLPVTGMGPAGFGLVGVEWCWVGGGASCGLVLGVAQWLVLRQVVQSAGWWIPINVVSWAAGAISGQYAGRAIWSLLDYGRSTGWIFVKAAWYDSFALNLTVLVLNVGFWPGHLVVSTLVSAITGLALIWLLSRPSGSLR